MVVAFVAIAKSVGQQCLKRSKPYSNSYFSRYGVQKWQFQSHRTLILQSASESVKLERLSDSDSGILEVKLDRPEARNAIGKDMLRGLQQAFEAVSNERSANVLMICSSVPKVFCAGADLKEITFEEGWIGHTFLRDWHTNQVIMQKENDPSQKLIVIHTHGLHGGSYVKALG
ncbi:hypothetical protein MTR67_036908 [Solanum verrucosum]|uniref:Uncharacterized protein n=1 Tax=Solanum verrucosum TaxID=315347 RepID=A0AAF0UCL4_SOLVR|nr:hypothetical protein MTR67_036908 [Solanum verrucosum]